MTDQHLHNRTDCLVCLRVPNWQWGLFYTEGDFCEQHRYSRAYYANMLLGSVLYLTEYHDGREARELVEREAEMRPKPNEFLAAKEADFIWWMYNPERPTRFQDEVNQL